jgi:hypothetical protein
MSWINELMRRYLADALLTSAELIASAAAQRLLRSEVLWDDYFRAWIEHITAVSIRHPQGPLRDSAWLHRVPLANFLVGVTGTEKNADGLAFSYDEESCCRRRIDCYFGSSRTTVC